MAKVEKFRSEMITVQCHSGIPLLIKRSSISSSSSPHTKTQISPLFCFKSLHSFSSSFHRTRNHQAAIGRKNSNGEGVDPVQESAFFDERGAVEDMDGYLNYLSLEYESVWDTKPSWCQPWTITLTGVSIVTVSWLALNSIAVTSVAAALIGLWWYTFLYSYPKSYSEMIAERKKKVKGGLEDTYGAEKG